MEDRSFTSTINKDTYERVRRTLDDALAELELSELVTIEADRSAPHSL